MKTFLIIFNLLLLSNTYADVFELNELYIDYRHYKLVNPNSRNPLIYPEPPKEGINLGLKTDIMSYFYFDSEIQSLTTDGQYRSIGLDTRLGVRLSSNLELGFWHKSQHLLDKHHSYMDKFPSEDAVQIKYYLFQGKKRDGLF